VHGALFQLEAVEVLCELGVSVGHVVILLLGRHGALVFGVGVWVYLVGGISFVIDEWFLHQILYMNTCNQEDLIKSCSLLKHDKSLIITIVAIEKLSCWVKGIQIAWLG
jgi:hypothetical protein